jgi:hypothetical protein
VLASERCWLRQRREPDSAESFGPVSGDSLRWRANSAHSEGVFRRSRRRRPVAELPAQRCADNSQMPRARRKQRQRRLQGVSSRRARCDAVTSKSGSQGSHGSGERSSRTPTVCFMSQVAWQPGTLVLISCVKKGLWKNKSMKFQGFLPDSSGFVGKIWTRDSLLTAL